MTVLKVKEKTSVGLLSRFLFQTIDSTRSTRCSHGSYMSSAGRCRASSDADVDVLTSSRHFLYRTRGQLAESPLNSPISCNPGKSAIKPLRASTGAKTAVQSCKTARNKITLVHSHEDKGRHGYPVSITINP